MSIQQHHNEEAELDLDLLQRRLASIHASLTVTSKDAAAVITRLAELRISPDAEVKQRALHLSQACLAACFAISAAQTKHGMR